MQNLHATVPLPQPIAACTPLFGHHCETGRDVGRCRTFRQTHEHHLQRDLERLGSTPPICRSQPVRKTGMARFEGLRPLRRLFTERVDENFSEPPLAISRETLCHSAAFESVCLQIRILVAGRNTCAADTHVRTSWMMFPCSQFR